MKKILILLAGLVSYIAVYAQGSINKNVTVKELEVPSSPAFVITESTPSLIQTPTTPKSFVLGIAQSFEPGTSFPQNYSAEFAPYWWFSSSDRNVYTLLGLTRSTTDNTWKENIFSGLKFTSVSIAFLSKDLVPDEVEDAQKMFSAGIRSTLIKVHSKSYATRLQQQIAQWNSAAQNDLVIYQERATRARTAEERTEILRELANHTPANTGQFLEKINEMFLEKPLFIWDIAAAHVYYGIGDTVWKSGRTGVWTNIATFLPLQKNTGGEAVSQYLNLNFSIRFLSDDFFKNDEGEIGRESVVDIGGKIAFEFNKLSIGYEYLKRVGDKVPGDPFRSVGVINYRIRENLFLNGGFGKSFQSPDKLVGLLGINWGLSKESLKIPD